jgi:predicted transcriptional regulator
LQTQTEGDIGYPQSSGVELETFGRFEGEMESQTIRVSKTTRDILHELAVKAGTTMAAIAEEAVKEYEKKKFWENYYAGYKALRADAIAWAEYQDEIKLWETTLADGLEEWPNE